MAANERTGFLHDIRNAKSATRLFLFTCLGCIMLAFGLTIWAIKPERMWVGTFVIEKLTFLCALAFGAGKASEEIGSAISSVVNKLKGTNDATTGA